MANEGELKYEGVVDEEMFVVAQRLHAGRRLAIPWLFPVVLTAFMILYRWQEMGESAIFLAPVGLAIGSLFPLLFRWWTPHQWRKLYRRSPYLSQPARCSVTQSGIEYTGQNGSGVTRFSNCVKMKENDFVVLLYYSPVLFLMIPRRLFSSDDDWLRAKVMIRSGMEGKAKH